MDEASRPTTHQHLTRRQFLVRSALVGSAGLVVGGVGGVVLARFLPSGQTQALTNYPQMEIGHLSNVQVGKPLAFDYPLQGQSNYLIRLGKAAIDGVGPDEDVVAFSTTCVHMGCPLSGRYQTANHVLGPCPCHLSTFDLSVGGMPVIGAGTENLPQIELHVDQSGTIFATGVWGVIYGFESNQQPGTAVR
jgi:arsenite oxidase small subunit